MPACNHSFSASMVSLKTGSYAIMHLVVAVAVAYVLTLDWRKALAIGLVEPFVQTFAFTLHDRYWRGREQRAGEIRSQTA
jgi:uncharacterized membrane protein